MPIIIYVFALILEYQYAGFSIIFFGICLLFLGTFIVANIRSKSKGEFSPNNLNDFVNKIAIWYYTISMALAIASIIKNAILLD